MQARTKNPDASSRRRDIMEEAIALFLTRGYAGTSMSDLARACGIQKASLYHHFAGKDALFVACVTEGYEEGTRMLMAIRDDETLDDADRIRAAISTLYRIIVCSPVGRLSPLIAEVSTQMPDVADTFYQVFMRRQHDVFNDIVDRGLASSAFRPHDRLGMEHMVFGPIVTLSLSREMLAASERRDELFPVDEIRESHTAMILTLLGHRPVDRAAKLTR